MITIASQLSSVEFLKDFFTSFPSLQYTIVLPKGLQTGPILMTLEFLILNSYTLSLNPFQFSQELSTWKLYLFYSDLTASVSKSFIVFASLTYQKIF